MKHTFIAPHVAGRHRILLAALAIVAFMLSVSFAYAGENSSYSTFSASAHLTGQQEVPAVNSTTTGSFELKNDNSYLLSVYKGKDITAAHLHCAPAGQNGPVVVNLYEMDMPSVDGPLAAGTINDSHIYPEGANCSTPIHSVADLKQAIVNGIIYVNVHTKKNPNGEVRGQLSGAFSGGYGYDNGHKDDKKDYNDGYHKDNKHSGGSSYGQATAVSYSSAQAYGGSAQASAASYAAAQGSSAYSASYSAASAQSSQKKSYNDYNDYGHDDKKDDKDKKDHDYGQKYDDKSYGHYGKKDDQKKGYGYDEKKNDHYADKKDHDYGNKDDSKQDNRYGHYDKKDDKSFSKHSYSGTNHNSYAANIRADVNDMLDAKLKVGLNF